MYKVFYNEKMLILSEKPLDGIKNLLFSTDSQFDEALAKLRNSTIEKLNIYYHNVEKLLGHLKSHFDSLDAAGGVVENEHNEILFIYRLGKWDLPKGKVEKGETTEVAAVREVVEECGIEAPDLGELITVTYHIYFQKDFKFKSVYWYKMKFNGKKTPIPQNEEGIEIAAWKPKNELKTLMGNTYENIKIVIEQYLNED